MSHQCLRCMTLYSDSANEVLQGCACGSKAFLFIRDSSNAQLNSTSSKITVEISNDPIVVSDGVVYEDVLHIELDDENRLDGPVKEIDSDYVLNVQELMHKKDAVYSPEEGKYTINLESVFSGQRPKL